MAKGGCYWHGALCGRSNHHLCRSLGQEWPTSASNRLTLGVIGLGSMGLRNLIGFLAEKDCQVVAVCDVDAQRRREALTEVANQYGGKTCDACNDFRDVVARKDIDLLCISVPDHWHSIVSIAGISAGKDIYGEKPLALTISEGRAMADTVTRHSCVWQTGSWQRSTRISVSRVNWCATNGSANCKRSKSV